MFYIQERYYTEDSDVVAWIYASSSHSLQSLINGVGAILRSQFVATVTNKDHPSRGRNFRTNLMQTNITIRDESGKLVKWKHLL